jgi:hypothetical protein
VKEELPLAYGRRAKSFEPRTVGEFDERKTRQTEMPDALCIARMAVSTNAGRDFGSAVLGTHQ